jgi:heme/copper-type cytochrome/quinol oxidase subunit 3
MKQLDKVHGFMGAVSLCIMLLLILSIIVFTMKLSHSTKRRLQIGLFLAIVFCIAVVLVLTVYLIVIAVEHPDIRCTTYQTIFWIIVGFLGLFFCIGAAVAISGQIRRNVNMATVDIIEKDSTESTISMEES